jgi:predicted nucleic acid-binding protein
MIVDTSYLLSLYVKDDPNHHDAISQIENEQVLLIPDYVVSETATVLLYRKNPKTAKSFLEIVENTQSIQILHSSVHDFREILEIFKNQKNKLTFVDAVVVFHAEKLRLGVLTFDEHIKKEISHR